MIFAKVAAAWRPLERACCVALAWGVGGAVPSNARADDLANAAAAARDPVITMQRFIVSATRIEKNPWRYASVPGFEVLSRASREKTAWLLAGFERGLWLERRLMPGDWLPPPPVPYTIIVDDADLEAESAGQIHSQPVVFRPPADALVWGNDRAAVTFSHDAVAAGDRDTVAVNSNLYGIDAVSPVTGSITLKRLYHCTPPLPGWLMAGLLGQNGGIFREGEVILRDPGSGIEDHGFPAVEKAEGAGMQWGSPDQTRQLLQQMKKDRKAKIAVPPLSGLFAEEAPLHQDRVLWESEAGLFVRWGLIGPGHEDPVLAAAFLEFVRGARREPVTEQMFARCFGFGYAAMEERLATYLKAVLAQPTSVMLDGPPNFPEPDLKAATADQIGRILGDWLRMKGESLGASDPELSGEFLTAAERLLLRAYKEDNGLPPDVDPSAGGGRSGQPPPNSAVGAPIVMQPFVVAATRLHDPDLLAVYGLYEYDIGEVGKAREFLEAAAKAGARRPRAWIALADLRQTEASGKPLGADGKLSGEQAASILQPLRMALHASPDPELCSQMVAIWRENGVRPSEDEIADVVAAIALFPRNTDLASRAALFCAHHGYPGRAAELIDQALVFTTDADDRDDLEQLRSSLGPAALSVPR